MVGAGAGGDDAGDFDGGRLLLGGVFSQFDAFDAFVAVHGGFVLFLQLDDAIEEGAFFRGGLRGSDLRGGGGGEGKEESGWQR